MAASEQQLVLAIFADEAAADNAVETLRRWDRMYREVKLDAIGVLVLDEKGQLKAHKAGNRAVGKGMGIGLVLAAITPPTLIAGLVIGGAAGALHRKGLGLDAAISDRLATELQGGKAAVGVLSDPGRSAAIMSVMRDVGGVPEVHDLDAAAVAEAAAAAGTEDAAPTSETS